MPDLCESNNEAAHPKAIIKRHYQCLGEVYHRDKIYQASKNPRQLLAKAKGAQPGFDRVMGRLVGRIKGAKYEGSRIKGMARLKEKLDSWRTADKIADYMGCRITVENHRAMEEVLVALSQRFDVVAHEDFLDGHAFKTGYRAIHTQLVGRRLEALGGDEYWRRRPCKYQWGKDVREEHEWPLRGLSVEVQVLPVMVADVQHKYRWVYEKWRPYQMDHNAKEMDTEKEEERKKDFGEMTEAFRRAAVEWNGAA